MKKLTEKEIGFMCECTEVYQLVEKKYKELTGSKCEGIPESIFCQDVAIEIVKQRNNAKQAKNGGAK